MSTIIDSAIAWAVSIANDDTHGYDQTNRWGPDYDCSTLVISAFEQAGVSVKSYGATYTGDMVDAFLKCGFTDVTNGVNLSTAEGLIKGDVLWRTGHTEIFIGNGEIVGASMNENGEATGGLTGDQTGNEIRVRDYYNSPWEIVLRYTDQSQTTPTRKKRNIFFNSKWAIYANIIRNRRM